jgi:hypothetical protein
MSVEKRVPRAVDEALGLNSHHIFLKADTKES